MNRSLIILFLMITTTVSANENPFFKPFGGPHGTAPFDDIKIEHYEPAFERAMAEHRVEIDAIAGNPAPATFENTIEAMESAGEMLNRVTVIFSNLLSSESCDEMMAISQRLSPKLSEHSNYINLNEKLFDRVKSLYLERENLNLTGEQIRLLEKLYEGFENSGATLSVEDKEIYRDLSAELSMATLQFGQNILRETNRYEMLLNDEKDLEGLPKSELGLAAAKAKDRGKEGWLFDFSAPSYGGFMKYSARRDLRERLYLDYSRRSVIGGEYDNREVVQQIVNLRLQIANLLGYDNYAEYVLKNRMAKNSEAVFDLLDRLAEAFRPTAESEVRELTEFASMMEGEDMNIEPWDWSYYSEKLRDNRFSLNDEITRPYFELENVKKGVFGLATDLYGLRFVKNSNIQVYHPDVEAFELFDETGEFLAVLYTDFFPRKGKRQGAWMSSFRRQYIRDGVDIRPHITIVMNFTPPTGNDPVLLTFGEVNTFLHEFGHALHGILSRTTYRSLSGTAVYRDFVELPSHIMENWLTEKEYLDRFAFHYQTGEKMPDELLHKIVDAANFNVGYAALRQLSFGYLDMAWHTLEKPFAGDVVQEESAVGYRRPIREFEHKAMSRVQLLPVVDENSMSVSFSHIFSGGYAAGYYSYKWAEVMEADAFSLFRERGIFDRETAASFRKNILERGNSEDPLLLYKRFRGREASVDALLKRSGVKVDK